MSLKFNPFTGTLDYVGTSGGGGGTGDFVGPSSSTDNAIVRFDGTTGKLGQNSGLTITDANRLQMGFNEIYQPTITGGKLGGQLDGNAQSLVNLSYIGSLTTGNLELFASGGSGTYLKLNYLDAGAIERTGISIQTGVTHPTVAFGPDGAGVIVDLENNDLIGLEAVTGSPDGTLAITSSNNHDITITPNGTGVIKLAAFTGLAKLTSGTLSAATAGTDYVTASSTNTFTNKTYDTAASGNSLSINGVAATANTGTGAVVRANTPTLVTPNIAKITNLTANGLVTTTSSDGTLVISTFPFVGTVYLDGFGNFSTPPGLVAPIFDHFADANNTNTSETDLYSDTLSAGKLAANGQKISGYYGGIFTGAATSTQRLKVYFGGTAIYDSGALAIGAATDNWAVNVEVIRVSASVVRCIVRATSDFATVVPPVTYTEVTGLTLANTQIIKITGTAAGIAGASNQITAKQGSLTFLPNA